jgi:uncharacterized protein
MNDLIGRSEEIVTLQKLYKSTKSEFVALYGRRRVGKTFLVREVFKNKFLFQLTGLANATLENQLLNFKDAFSEQYPKHKIKEVTNWIAAFDQIKTIIKKSKQAKKIIFIDELPWLDTPNSNFIQALEHFWNSWASARNDVKLIVCGSSASWMINELINNKGGLHNRVTQRLKIEPFTLKECALYAKSKKHALENYQILQLYMAFGGIPFYWDRLEKGSSTAQNIDNICFSKNGLLTTEFNNIFKSLFNKDENHQKIVEALATKNKGLSREEIIKITKLNNGGSLTRVLNELEESGFIKKYVPFGKKSRNSLYQLIDLYTLFYLKFIKNHTLHDKQHWIKIIDNPTHRAWSGYAFEQVCLYHLDEIKSALGITGIDTRTSSWKSIASKNGAQVDLVIDRRDESINLCEMKFSINPFTITKKYEQDLRNKIGVFKAETKTKKSVFLTMLTSFGIEQNRYSDSVQNNLTMSIFF